jgi:hypothetical protein
MKGVMMSEDDAYYEALADAVERGDLAAEAGSVLRGEDAAAAGRQMLMAATDASTVEGAQRMAVGRPRGGHSKGGASPEVHIRVEPEMRDALRARAKREGKTVSEVGRAALDRYLAGV